MAEYSRYIGRLVIGWRMALLVVIAVDFLGSSDAGFSVLSHLKPWFPALTPTPGMVALTCFTFVGLGMSLVLNPKERAIPLAFVDTLNAVMCSIAFPKSVAATFLFSLPVLDVAAFGGTAAIFAGLLFFALYPGLVVARGGPIADLRELVWYGAFMFISTMMALVMQAQLRQEEQAQAVVSVIQTSQELGTSASLEKIITVAVRDIRALFDCTDCVVYLRNLKDPTSTFLNVADTETPNKKAFIEFDPGQKKSIIGDVMKEKKATLVDDFQSYASEEAIKKEMAPQIRSAMIAPLLFEDEALGALFVSHQSGGYYQLGALRLFTLLANQLGVAVRNVQLQKTTEEMAITDSLSGLYTHGYFQGSLDALIADAKYNSRQPISLAILDIDFFKRVNDSYGHPQGDALLKQLGTILKHTVRPTDILCRYGGDEFVITMPNTTHAEAAIVTERVRHATEEYEFALGRKIVHVTVSGGIATFPDDAETKVDLIAKADAAMYRAKQRGRNCVVRRGEGAVLYQTVGDKRTEEAEESQ